MWQHFVLSTIWRNLDNKDIESDRNRISEELLKLGGRPKISIFRGGEGTCPTRGKSENFHFQREGEGLPYQEDIFQGRLIPFCILRGWRKGVVANQKFVQVWKDGKSFILWVGVGLSKVGYCFKGHSIIAACFSNLVSFFLSCSNLA